MYYRYRSTASGRIPAICSEVTTVTTPESIDVAVSGLRYAINPRRQDMIEAMKGVDLPFKTIEELRDIAYSIVASWRRFSLRQSCGYHRIAMARSWTLYARLSHMSLLSQQRKKPPARSRHLFLVRGR